MSRRPVIPTADDHPAIPVENDDSSALLSSDELPDGSLASPSDNKASADTDSDDDSTSSSNDSSTNTDSDDGSTSSSSDSSTDTNSDDDSPNSAQLSVRAQFQGFERENTHWKMADMEPVEDLKNVLAGYDARVAKKGQVVDSLEDVHAVSTVGKDINKTAVGKLLQDNKAFLEESIEKLINKIAPPTFDKARIINRIKNADLLDSDEVADIYKTLMTLNSRDARVGEALFNQVAQYLVMKNRLDFATQYPTQITPSDGLQQAQEKITLQNKAYTKQVHTLKAEINKKLQPSSRIRGNAMEEAAAYTNKAFQTGAKFEIDFRLQKQALLEHTATTLDVMQAAGPKKMLDHLNPAEQNILLEFEPLFDELKTTSQKPEDIKRAKEEHEALSWSLKDAEFAAVAQFAPTQQNIDALQKHRTNRPSELDDPQSAISRAIAPQLQNARPILNRLIASRKRRILVERSVPAIEAVERDTEIKALRDQLHNAEDAFLSKHSDVIPKTLYDHTDTLRLQSRHRNNPTQDNQQDLDNFTRENPVVGGANYDDKIENLARQLGELEAEKQKAELADPDIQSKPAYKIAQARLSYEATLEDMQSMMVSTSNPHPTFLANIQQTVDAARSQYQQTVMGIHKEAGTDKILSDLSTPLNAMRDNPHGNPLATMLDKSGSSFRAGFKQEAARLPVLDPYRYELAGKTLPSVLLQIDRETNTVNRLLKEREHLERATEANPQLAKDPDYLKEIHENTTALQKHMTQLTHHVGLAQPGLLQTHPNVEEWARKVGRLQQAVNGQSFRGRIADNLKQVGSGGLFKKKGPPQSVPNIKYNSRAAQTLNKKDTTTYLEEIRPGEYRAVNLKAEITQKDGSKKMEKVKFSRAEIQNLFAEFCDMNDNLEKEVKVTITSDGKLSYEWPNQQYKEEWLKFLKSKYTEKRKEEIQNPSKTPKHEAAVDVKTPRPTHDDHSPPPTMGGGPR